MQGGKIPCRGHVLWEPEILGSPGAAAGGCGHPARHLRERRGASGAAGRRSRLAAGTRNSHLANSAAESVPPQPLFLAPCVTLSALGARCAARLGSPVPFPGAPDLPLYRRISKLARGYLIAGVRGGGGEDTTYPPNYAQARLCFPIQINFKEQILSQSERQRGRGGEGKLFRNSCCQVGEVQGTILALPRSSSPASSRGLEDKVFNKSSLLPEID